MKTDLLYEYNSHSIGAIGIYLTTRRSTESKKMPCSEQKPCIRERNYLCQISSFEAGSKLPTSKLSYQGNREVFLVLTSIFKACQGWGDFLVI